MKNQTLNPFVKTLIEKGVKIYNPESVYIADNVDLDRISGENTTIHTGCKIFGKKTLIMANTQIGHQAPVSLENTLVGKNVRLEGGYFKEAVFAGNNNFGLGAQVRENTILEEYSKAAHTVGLKQTILFPFVTLGSLINFCDCLMAGGTSVKNHSEVGSSFIHFNYTPNQDKATASIFGDVHNGVMLNSKPIFLGGQGGVVGPVCINYGCVSAAGSIIRQNESKQDMLLFGKAFKSMNIPRQPFVYQNISRVFNNNRYIAELIVLKSWYQHIRKLFIYDDFSDALHQGMIENLNKCVKERIRIFKDFCSKKLNHSKEILLKLEKKNHNSLIDIHTKAMDKFWQAYELFDQKYNDEILSKEAEQFIKIVENKIIGKDYIKTIQNLSIDEREQGSQWLLNIERSIIDGILI